MISKGNETKRMSFLLVVISFNLDIGDMISGTMPYSQRRFMLHKLTKSFGFLYFIRLFLKQNLREIITEMNTCIRDWVVL